MRGWRDMPSNYKARTSLIDNLSKKPKQIGFQRLVALDNLFLSTVPTVHFKEVARVCLRQPLLRVFVVCPRWSTCRSVGVCVDPAPAPLARLSIDSCCLFSILSQGGEGGVWQLIRQDIYHVWRCCRSRSAVLLAYHHRRRRPRPSVKKSKQTAKSVHTDGRGRPSRSLTLSFRWQRVRRTCCDGAGRANANKHTYYMH